MATQATSYMLNRDARQAGVVNGTKVGGTRKPRTRTIGLTDVKVTFADGRTELRTAASFRPDAGARTVAGTRTRKQTTRTTLAARDIRLMAAMGTIHGEGQ